jgi:hypothetical protein
MSMTPQQYMEKASQYMTLAKEGMNNIEHNIEDELEKTILNVVRKNLYRDLPEPIRKGRGRRSKYTLQQRRDAVLNHKTLKETCKLYNITPPTFYKWQKGA